MKTTSTEPMDASKQFCPNEACSARGQMGAGNIRMHAYQPQRYRCRTCKKTLSARRGTMMEGLRTPTALLVIVVTLLSYGCPIQAIVHAYGVDERTVAAWQKRAGKHCQQVHQAIVEQGKVQTHHVQADAHPGERQADDRLDGHGYRCDESFMDGRGGEHSSRSSTGRSVTPTGARLLSRRASASGLYRRVERVCEQHSACLSRKSEEASRARKSGVRRMARALYRDGDQAHEKEAGGGSHPQAHLGNA